MTVLSVPIPAFNEEGTIRQVLTAVGAQRIPGVTLQVIVVDDCSTDGTVAAARECAGMYQELISLPRNGGKGAAVIAGLRAATGDYVLVQDADLEYNWASAELLGIELMLSKLIATGSVFAWNFLARNYLIFHEPSAGPRS